MKVLTSLCDKYGVDVISVGNGTASRESEKIIADFLKTEPTAVRKSSAASVINWRTTKNGEGGENA